MKIPVDLVPGRRGQFEVWVGNERVAERKGGLLALLLRRPWPTPEAIVERVSAHLP